MTREAVVQEGAGAKRATQVNANLATRFERVDSEQLVRDACRDAFEWKNLTQHPEVLAEARETARNAKVLHAQVFRAHQATLSDVAIANFELGRRRGAVPSGYAGRSATCMVNNTRIHVLEEDAPHLFALQDQMDAIPSQLREDLEQVLRKLQ